MKPSARPQARLTRPAIALVALVGPVVAAPFQGQEDPQTPLYDDPAGLAPSLDAPGLELVDSVPIHGFLGTVYRGRWTAGESDNDLRAWAYVDIGDEQKNPFTARFNALLYWDIDGRSGEDGQFPFFEITDTYDGSINARLYEAFVDAHCIDGLARGRLGRQQLYETPVLAWFDGAYLESETTTDKDLSFGAYGGLPVHVFESSPEGNALFGLFTAGRPWKRARLRFDYMRLQDERFFGEQENDLFNLRYWQTLTDGLNFEGDYSYLDDASRDVRARATYYHAPSDLTLQFSYYQLLQTQADLALELNPLYGSLLELFPYYQTRFLVSKSLLERLYLEGGFDIRRVDDANDVGQFNRDFERYYGIATLRDLGQEGLDLNLNADVYDSDGSDVQAWGANLNKSFNERWAAGIGTYFSLFKYDYTSGTERDHVRTYYVKVDYDWSADLTFDAGYEFEDDEFDDYQTLRLGMTWRF